MQKLILIIFIAILIAAGGIVWYVENYSNETYYVQIHNDGKIEKDGGKSNLLLGFYAYKIRGYNSEGVGKELNFKADHNLRHSAYLKVLDSGKRGTISWEEIQRENIPKKALVSIDEQNVRLFSQNK